MAKAKDTQSAGSETRTGDDGKGGLGGDSPDPKAAGGEGGEGGDPPPPSSQYLTPEILQGVLARRDKTSREELQKFTGTYEKRLDGFQESLEKALARLESSSAGKVDKPAQKELPELVEMKNRIKELESLNKEFSSKAEEASAREKKAQFRQRVLDVLRDNKCRRPQETLDIIEKRLTQDEQNSERIYATVPTDFGPREMELEKYVPEIVRETIVPEFFPGMMRNGAAVEGGDSAGGQKGKIPREKLGDAQWYSENVEEARKALEAGQYEK